MWNCDGVTEDVDFWQHAPLVLLIREFQDALTIRITSTGGSFREARIAATLKSGNTRATCAVYDARFPVRHGDGNPDL